MGYQLWTSPLTGYRRHGTRLSNFKEALGGRILANDICELLQCCPSGAPADEMQLELKRLDFTIAGVKDFEDGDITGFVRADELSDGAVLEHLRLMSEAIIINDDTPLQKVLKFLEAEPFLFVRSPTGISAILTWADLNKPIVRIYMFGLISLLEMHLSFWISTAYHKGTWKEQLTENRISAAEVVKQERAKRGQDLPLIQCLQLCDKRTLISKSNDIRTRLNLGSKKNCKRFLENIEVLRDSLAHSQYELAPGNSWQSLLLLVDRMQAVITTSDKLVEVDAMDKSADFTSLLW